MPVRTPTPTVHWALLTQAAAAIRASAGVARISSSRSLTRSPEDRQVQEPAGDAQHRPVQVEQPLVLPHGRAEQLLEVVGRHLAHALREQRAYGLALPPVEVRIGERGHRV